STPNGVLYANQWENLANRPAHLDTTGPGTWEQTDGPSHRLTCPTGTGRTLAGTAMYLKSQNPRIRIAAADPMGAAMYSWITHGKLEGSGNSITEGIGLGRVTANIDGAPIDLAYQIPDEEALPIVFDLLS